MQIKTTSSLWTLRNAVEGVQIFGGIGSGKTSGSGRMLGLKYLSAGLGGLVLSSLMKKSFGKNIASWQVEKKTCWSLNPAAVIISTSLTMKARARA